MFLSSRNLLAALLSAAVALPLSAQIANGYYRVQNNMTKRYITFVDSHGSASVSGGTVTAYTHAFATIKGLDNVISDPSSVIYIRQAGTSYEFCSQGISSTQLTQDVPLTLSSRQGSYIVGGTYQGLGFRLCDLEDGGSRQKAQVYLATNSTPSAYLLWDVLPIASSGSNYFGVKPDLSLNGKYYATLYGGFAFDPAKSSVKAYYVAAVDLARGFAVYREVEGIVPEGTGVFLECSGSAPSDNRLELQELTGNKLSVNRLQGVYFCYYGSEKGETFESRTAYDPKIHRVLGTTADGRIGFVTNRSLSYLPANKAYLTVDSSAPDEIALVTPEEYAAGVVTLTADAPQVKSGVYDLHGRRVAASQEELPALKAGVYLVGGRKVVVK